MSENETLKCIRDDITNYLSGKRLSHTLSVMEEAEKLGTLYGLSENDIARLRLAGLLHDITKEKSPDQQLELCRRFGYKYTEDDVNSPKVFHSITGAYLARHKVPYYRTTGNDDLRKADLSRGLYRTNTYL